MVDSAHLRLSIIFKQITVNRFFNEIAGVVRFELQLFSL